MGYDPKYATKFDPEGKPIMPAFRHGSGFQTEKKNYDEALRKWNASNLTTGKTQADPGQILTGKIGEQKGQVAGLNLAALGYGQSLGETGEDIQRIKELQKDRTNQSGSDPVSAAIMNQKAGQVASAGRSMAASGVKGGAAAGAISNISRAADADIAASLYGQQRQSITDERSLASNMLSGTTSLMYGGQGEGAKSPDAPKASSWTDSVICTELYSQGIMPLEIYIKDSHYGLELRQDAPHIIVGYHLWAKPVAKLMKKSKLFTKIISYPAMKWANHMAGEENSIMGHMISVIGESVCGILGKIKLIGDKYAKSI